MSTTMTPEQMAELSIEQLRALIEEHEDNPETQQALTALLDRRVELEAKEEEVKQRRSRKGSPRGLSDKEPEGRAIQAADSFMADPDRVAIWDRAIEAATQPDGKVVQTGKLIQLCVGSYYAQRKRDKDAAKAESDKATAGDGAGG